MNKTVPTEESVDDFLATIEDAEQRKDCYVLVQIMQAVSGKKPVLWGPNIIGFGTMHYTYASGREGDWMKIGFSPRKGKLSLYITGDASMYADELASMGKTKIGKGCIYIQKLADIDTEKLKALIQQAYIDGAPC